MLLTISIRNKFKVIQEVIDYQGTPATWDSDAEESDEKDDSQSDSDSQPESDSDDGDDDNDDGKSAAYKAMLERLKKQKADKKSKVWAWRPPRSTPAFIKFMLSNSDLLSPFI